MTSNVHDSSTTPTTAEKLRGLPWGVAWSVTNTVFAQYTFFGSIFVLFLNQLGLVKSQIGGLLSLLPFFGIVAVFAVSTISRFGYKRSFLLSFSIRTGVGALLLLTPFMMVTFGPRIVLPFIIAIVGVFGLFRAIGVTALNPWLHEQVPDSIRGKYSATKNSLASLAAFLAMLIAGYWLGPDPDLDRFMMLIGVGVTFGVISVWMASRMPGGAVVEHASKAGSLQQMISAAKDSNFSRFMIGVCLVNVAVVPLISFVPLFMKEQVGLSADRVVWLDTGLLMGGLASSFFWGWLADRYGSKPIMLSAVFFLSLLPLCWLLIPRQTGWSLYLALAIALFQGFSTTGWNIGSARLLFVRVVRPKNKDAYLALYYAVVGIAGGVGQLFGGRIVDLSAGVNGRWWLFELDPYTILFVIGIAFPMIALVLFRYTKADSSVSVGEFAGMFVRGNPFLALESLIRYHRARDERSTIAMTERLGSTKSPLTVQELLEALHDPRFFVRFEAIVSIARSRPDPRLTDALIEILEGNEPALGTIGAWALGRIGDERALEALREGLDAPYRSIQAHCARSLANLGDTTVIPILQYRLAGENDRGLQLAFATSLGKLGATDAVGPLLVLLHHARRNDERMELALAVARLIGDEHQFIQLHRRVELDPGTTLAQAVSSLLASLPQTDGENAVIADQLTAADGAFAQEDLDRGVALLQGGLELLAIADPDEACNVVVRECVVRLGEFRSQRLEYVILALHALICRFAD